MGSAEHSIIAELEDAIKSGSSERRVQTLRQVTNLFLNDAERLTEDQVQVFDDVLSLLVARVESRARAELSTLLAPNDHAPLEVVRKLARDDEIAVASGVLANSTRLRTADLVEIATAKGQDHLLAISGRANLPESVTDVILDRGEGRVIRQLAANASARFSDTGYSTLVQRADADAELAELVGLRIDLPQNHLRELLRRATEAVRAKLMAIAPAELQDEIKRVIKAIAAVPEQDPSARDFSLAEHLVKLMHGRGELNDGAVIKFAQSKKFNEVAASLAILSGAATDMIARVLEGPRTDLVLIPCKSSGLNWATTEAVLHNRPARPVDERTLSAARRDFERLSIETAQRTVRFWQIHKKVDK
jgi:uncharacterized protein (DUF2336 family)